MRHNQIDAAQRRHRLAQVVEALAQVGRRRCHIGAQPLPRQIECGDGFGMAGGGGDGGTMAAPPQFAGEAENGIELAHRAPGGEQDRLAGHPAVHPDFLGGILRFAAPSDNATQVEAPASRRRKQ